MLEADVGFLNITSGVWQASQPPGFLVRDAPRKTARGRVRDRLLLRMDLQLDTASSQNISINAVLLSAHKHFYGTPGSLTAAARAAIYAVNHTLLTNDVSAHGSNTVDPGVTCAVLRGNELYLIQTGPGIAFIIHRNNTQQFPVSGRVFRPIGDTHEPDIHYFHTNISAGDWLLMCHKTPNGWRNDTFPTIHYDDPESAIRQLVDLSGDQSEALVCRFIQPGSAAQVEATLNLEKSTLQTEEPRLTPSQPTTSELSGVAARSRVTNQANDYESQIRSEPVEETDNLPAIDHVVSSTSDNKTDNPITLAQELSGLETNPLESSGHESQPDTERHDLSGLPQIRPGQEETRSTPHLATSSPHTTASWPPVTFTNWLHTASSWFVDLPLKRTRSKIEKSVSSLQTSILDTLGDYMTRLMPIKTLVNRERVMPNRMLLLIAVSVPIAVVLLVIVMYMQLGRTKQLELYIEGARVEITQARTAPDAQAAEPHWRAAMKWLRQADLVRPGHEDTEILRTEARHALDSIDGIVRIEVNPLLQDRLEPGAEITRILTHGTTVYAFDFAHQRVYRAVLTTSGEYQMDQAFECQQGPVAAYTINRIVDIDWIETRSVVGHDTLVGLDPSGKLLYCPPDGSPPAATILSPPTSGWLGPVSIEIYADRLYILEPDANEIWIFRGAAESFSGTPERYFRDSLIDLSEAVDFAIAQRAIFILHSDGRVTQCTRQDLDETPQCVEVNYSDARSGHTSGVRLSGLMDPVSILYNPPPEPSIYLSDAASQATFQVSLGMAFQRQFRPVLDLSDPLEAFAIGPDRRLFFALGGNIYVGQLP